MKKNKLIAILTLMCFLFTLMPMAAMAAEKSVATEEELHNAVASAVDGDVIVLTQNITLTTELTISKDITLKGVTSEVMLKLSDTPTLASKTNNSMIYIGGEGGVSVTVENLIIDGNDTARLFYLAAGTASTKNTLTLNRGSKLQNGHAKGSSNPLRSGGAVWLSAHTDCTVNDGAFVINNAADRYCGGIYGWAADINVIINGGTITGNTTANYGAGITLLDSGVNLYIYGGTITNNTGGLGGIYLSNMTMHIGGSPTCENLVINSANTITLCVDKELSSAVTFNLSRLKNSKVIAHENYKLLQSDVDNIKISSSKTWKLNETNTEAVAIDAIQLTYEANYTDGPEAVKVKFPKNVETALKENPFVRTGYTFAGWNTEEDGSGEPYTNGAAVTFSDDITLYAQWKLCDHTANIAIDCVNETACSECGASVAPIGHDFENSTVWINNNPEGHYKQCVRCTVTDSEHIVAHNYDGHTDTACDTCGYVRSLVHDFTNGAWVTTDAAYHWKVCNDCDAENTENKVEHSYTYTSDAAAHDGVCVCGRTVTNEEHEYTNACDTDCNVCGYVRTIEHDYEWIVDKAATEYETGLKHEECTVCDAVRNVGTVIEKLPSTQTSSTGSSGGFSGSYNYPVSAPEVDSGDVKLSDSNAVEGENVTATVTPDNGYGVADVIVTDEDGNIIPVEFIGNGQYTFVMPDGEVSIEVVCKPAITMKIGDTVLNIFGKTMQNDVAPTIGEGNRTMLPIRAVANALGAEVYWDADNQKVTIVKDGKVIEVFIGKDYAFVDGERIELDAKAYIENDRTYLQVRFVTEALDAEVIWDPVKRMITIIPN